MELMKRVACRFPCAVLDFVSGIGQSAAHLRFAFSEARIVGWDLLSKNLDVAREDIRGGEFVFPMKSNQVCISNHALATCVLHPNASLLSRASEARRTGFLSLNKIHLIPLPHCCVDAILLTQWETSCRVPRAGFQISSAAYCLFFRQILSALRPRESFLGWLQLGEQYFVAGVHG
jgi:hypothetical protein